MVRRGRVVPAGQPGQGVARPHFQQHHGAFAEQAPHALGEAHGPAQVLGPIGRVRGLLGRDPVAREVGDEGRARGLGTGLGHQGLEFAQDGRHHVGVEGVGGVQPPHAVTRLVQLLFQGVDGLERPGNGDETGRVDRGQGEAVILRQPGGDVGLGHLHAEHGARRHALHQPPAGCDQGQGVLQLEDARQGGGRVFADAVADHGLGLRAPVHPQLGQRVFDGEERGLGVLRFLQLCRGRILLPGGREDQVADIQPQMGPQ